MLQQPELQGQRVGQRLQRQVGQLQRRQRPQQRQQQRRRLLLLPGPGVRRPLRSGLQQLQRPPRYLVVALEQLSRRPLGEGAVPQPRQGPAGHGMLNVVSKES